MSKLKKCEKCKEYTLEDSCKNCKIPTLDAHYKFIKIKDAPKTTDISKIRKN